MLQLIDKNIVSKQGVQDFSNQIIEAIDNGNVNPLELKAALKAIEKITEKVKEKLDKSAIDEANKYGKIFTLNGVTYEVSENLGVKYDYSECCDIDWEILNTEIISLTAQIKVVEKRLQAMKGSEERVNRSTGEVYTVYPPKRKSTTGVKVTI
jgi:hypothetical protein